MKTYHLATLKLTGIDEIGVSRSVLEVGVSAGVEQHEGDVLGSILQRRFGQNLRIKLSLVKCKFVIMTLHIWLHIKYLKVKDTL
jgi:hypothetical protein